VRVCSTCATKTDESGSYCPECGAVLVELSDTQKIPGLESTASLDTADKEAAKEAAASSAAKLIGLTIDGQFEVIGILGGGAFGTVYRARQIGLDRPVALKVPTAEIAADPVMARRFAREARSAAKVQHPGVVAIYAVGELPDGRPYLAMQLVEGQPLDQILTDGPLAPLRALTIVRAIASALSETHGAGVIHRDLKPSNIIWRVDRNGDDRITLVDFGIAVAKPGHADATRLTSGGLVGTPHYMSPEQAHGDEVDARADVYALGCVLFELVTGTPPFEGSGFEVLLAHLGRPAPLPSERNKDVPEAIDRLCVQLLAKKRDGRPASCDVLVAMIDTAIAELSGKPRFAAGSAARPPRAKRKPLPTRRDLPEGTEGPATRRTRRMLLGGALAGAALATAGFTAFELGHDHGASLVDASATEPSDSDDSPVNPKGGHRREVYKDDGEIVLHAILPDPIVAKHPVRPHLELHNKLGQPIHVSQIVVTVSDDKGNAKGLVASPHGSDQSHYGFEYAFPQPGHYVIQVFPPSVDSSFEIPVDVSR
jgi:serine/threonine protein kinase